jgi:Ca2+-binding RTX toxin-like protein
VELSAKLPIDTRLVSVVPSQGLFTNLSGDTTRGGIVKVELGSIDPDRGATVVVTYIPNTTVNFVLTDARVTSAQPDVDPSTNFANAGFTIIPSPPVLPVISVVATNDGIAREPDRTQLEGTDRETEFIITRTGGDLTRPLTVNYTLEGTAQNGVDFNPIGSSVTFAPFQTEVRVRIRPVQDRQVEGTEFVRLNLVPNPLVYNVNEPEGRSSARIDIVDVPNPVGPAPLPGTVVSLVAINNFADEFRPPSASGGFTPGAVSPIRGVLRISRDNTIGDLTVNVEISGTANRPDEPNSDYVLFDTLGRAIPVLVVLPVLPFPMDSSLLMFTSKQLTIHLKGEEEAMFNLAPGASYVIGRPQDIAAARPAVVRIRDNETPPTVTIVANTPFITEGQDIGIFQVIRTGDLSQPRTVIIEVSGSASPPRQIQRNNPPIPEDYAVTGSSVFLGDSNLTTDPNIANLGANRFLVTIPAGQDRTSILINPLADIVFDPREIIVARIVPPPNPQAKLPEDIPPQGFIVVGGSAVMTILDPAGDNPIVGTAGNDTIIGTNDGDFILGLQGDNYLQGLKGDDIIIGIEGNDTILGDEGNDFLIAAAGNDLLIGGVGGDTLDGGPGIDTMIGEDGDDLYVVDNASDVVFELPNEGNDTVESSVNFILPPNFENLQLIGNAIQGTGNELDNVIVGNDQGNILNGLGGDDTIFGLGGADVVNGGDGDDSIFGGSGDDNLSGGNGDDTILGEDGNDVISGGAGADSLSGGDGNDNITGGSGADTIDGGAGDDALDGGGGNDNINGGDGNDNIKGGDGIDTLVGGDGADTIDGGDGADTIVGGKGDDSLIGGDGDDTIDGGEGKDNISGGKGADSLIGGDGDDTINGGEGADTINGGADNDSINGGDGADSILGGSGDDTIDGGDGADTIDGGLGADSISGGDGSDFILGGFGADTIDGGSGADTIDGGLGADSISGGDGSDFILGGFGADTIDGGSGADTIDGGADNDSINGGDGADSILGGSGADTIDGGAGNDTIVGGLGDDSLTGGAGNDQFLFNFPNEGIDTITDFNVTFDSILISATGFGGGLVPGTPPPFTFGNLPITSSGEFIYNTTTGELRFDPDGTGPQPTVLLAVLTGNPALANTNIVIF